ncbi:Adenylosuccinate lyase [Porphyridium purpureum]|uniref:Adenylosuccinate lyase n=1 Tax=Porphyridium purpureum TaxID=35688 RepID=A0A5J4YS17_PORPP|nr:Adenylosuccinate lyase [Porphyridium purpureum]|eukprot:POR0704..scf229_5
MALLLWCVAAPPLTVRGAQQVVFSSTERAQWNEVDSGDVKRARARCRTGVIGMTVSPREEHQVNTQGDKSGSDEVNDPFSNYVSPLSTRYASEQMRRVFSDRNRFRIWRKLWIWLAESELELETQGVTASQVQALKDAPDVDIHLANQYERKLRHDVMAHVHAFGDQVPESAGIIHLGATSCFITDNSELIQFRDALDLLIPMLWRSVANLAVFAQSYASMPTLAYTHFQPAQPTTVGKRATLWLQDLLMDAFELEALRDKIRARGVKGTTGTQASFLSLFDGDHDKVKQLDDMVTRKMGFAKKWTVTGQTYTRKQDFWIICALAGVGQSAAKMANDIRLLQHKKEIEEPFESTQIGSSAMAYKRNPMRCERINSLARFLQTLVLNPAETASTQWLERTLDDSANRRLAMTEAFLTTDAILQLVLNVSSNLVVNDKVVAKHLQEELPFMATENIMMAATRRGGNRQLLHEEIRVHSMTAGARVKQGLDNNLLQLIEENENFSSVHADLEALCDPQQFVGRAPEQVAEFLASEVIPELTARGFSVERASGDVRI